MFEPPSISYLSLNEDIIIYTAWAMLFSLFDLFFVCVECTYVLLWLVLHTIVFSHTAVVM